MKCIKAIIIWKCLFWNLTIFWKNNFLKSPRKEVTSIRKAINSLDLTLSRNFGQQDSISFEMISLIVLIAGSNFCLDMHYKGTLTIATFIAYNYTKGTQKRQITVKMVPKKNVKNSSYITFIFLKMYFCCIGFLYHHVIDMLFGWDVNAFTCQYFEYMCFIVYDISRWWNSKSW